MTSSARRRPVMTMHRARPTTTKKEIDNMDSYKSSIIYMLDTITDAKLMRIIHDVVKAILMNR